MRSFVRQYSSRDGSAASLKHSRVSYSSWTAPLLFSDMHTAQHNSKVLKHLAASESFFFSIFVFVVFLLRLFASSLP